MYISMLRLIFILVKLKTTLSTSSLVTTSHDYNNTNVKYLCAHDIIIIKALAELRNVDFQISYNVVELKCYYFVFSYIYIYRYIYICTIHM